MNILDKLKIYIENNIEHEQLFRACKAKSFESYDFINLEESSLDQFIDNNKNENDFQKLLFSFIDNKNLKDSDVYNKVNIDRRTFSKIRNNPEYHPSKNTVILLGLSLELTEKEIEKLLESASYSLPKNNNRDLIIRFCFIEKIYNPIQVNELLDNYKCQLLEK